MSDHVIIDEYERNMPYIPSLCFSSEPQDVVKCLQSGCSYGLWLDEVLVAYSLAYFTEYGTAYIDKCFVRQECRGNGYQYILLNANLAKLVSNGVQEVFAMTSPNNEASIKSFTNAGFSFKRDTRYKGEQRIILKWEL